MRLEPLDFEDLVELVERAATDPERGVAAEGVAMDADAVRYLAEAAAGDARAALSGLESAVAAAKAAGRDRVDRALAEDVVQKKVVYDRDEHYDVISAFIKSMRGSDPDAALYWLARMIEAGEDPRFIARRMVIFASEDVGLADQSALQVAVAAAQAVEFVGLPEVALNLAHAVLYLANAPKSNSVVKGLGRAREDAARGDPVPRHLRDSSYPAARKLGHGKGYVYPHDDPESAAGQAYRPEGLQDRRYVETGAPEAGSDPGDGPGP
jgi:putative ATPase